MLKNPNPSEASKEIHVMLPKELAERVDEAVTLPGVKSKTQLVLEGLELILAQYGK